MISLSKRIAARLTLHMDTDPDVLRDILHDPSTDRPLAERARYVLAHQNTYRQPRDLSPLLTGAAIGFGYGHLFLLFLASIYLTRARGPLDHLTLLIYAMTIVMLVYCVYIKRCLSADPAEDVAE